MLGGFQGILDAFGVIFTEKKLHPCLYDILIPRYDYFQFKSMGFHHYFQPPYDPTNITALFFNKLHNLLKDLNTFDILCDQIKTLHKTSQTYHTVLICCVTERKE